MTVPTLPREQWPAIPNYSLLDVLGGGGYGIVFLAEEDSVLRRKCAIKVSWPSPLQDPEGTEERFVRETKTVSDLNHPQVVPYIHSGFTDGERRPFIVMAYVEGDDLRKVAPTYSAERACEVVLSALDTIEFCHSKDVIHRDLKPSNIMVRAVDGQPVLVDFGLSINIAAAVKRVSKQPPGTPGYMAPELIANPLVRDVRLDVYSMGVVLYEVLAGKLPDPTDPKPLGAFHAELDNALDEIVRGALATEAKRFPTARHFRERLSAWLALHRERMKHAGRLSPRAQNLRRGYLADRLRRVEKTKAAGAVAADMDRVARAQVEALTIKTIMSFEEAITSLKDQVPALTSANDPAAQLRSVGLEVEPLASMSAAGRALVFASTHLRELRHPITGEQLFKVNGRAEGVIAALQRVTPASPPVMPPAFVLVSYDAPDEPIAPWIHLAIVMVFEETPYVDASALKFVVEHHPKFVQVDTKPAERSSPDAVQDDIWRVIEWFVANCLPEA